MELDKVFEASRKNDKACIFCFPTSDLVVHETDSLRLLVDTFPIQQGHTLISSKAHFGCMGDLNESVTPTVMDVVSLLELAKSKNVEESLLIYEHGKAGSCHVQKGQFCEHFHLHLLPMKNEQVVKVFRSIIPLIKKIAPTFYTLNSFLDLPELYDRFGEYLLLSDGKNILFFPTSNKKIPSHFIRTLVCEELGVPEKSDWKNVNDKGLFAKNLISWKEAFNEDK